MALGGDGQEKGKASPRIEQVAHSSRKMVGTLGRLAFHGLVRRKYVFYEQDLKAFGVDLALLQSALCGCFLRREETLASSTAYCFTHLSLQEFVAAAYYYSASKRAIFDLFTEGGVSWPRLGFLTHFRSAAQRAMQAEDGRLDVFLRFLSGLLSPRVNALLSGSLPQHQRSPDFSREGHSCVAFHKICIHTNPPSHRVLLSACPDTSLIASASVYPVEEPP